MIVVADASVLVAELPRQRGRALLSRADLRVVVAEEQWDETEHELGRRLALPSSDGSRPGAVTDPDRSWVTRPGSGEFSRRAEVSGAPAARERHVRPHRWRVRGLREAPRVAIGSAR